jgi:hypothetical protein
MKAEIMNWFCDTKREVWNFSLVASTGDPIIYYDNYKLETRPTVRHRKWTTIKHWARLDRNTDLKNPPSIPTGIVRQMREAFMSLIKITPITNK